MKTYVITNTIKPSKVPFRIKAYSEDEALEKVFEYMGSNFYKVVSIED